MTNLKAESIGAQLLVAIDFSGCPRCAQHKACDLVADSLSLSGLTMKAARLRGERSVENLPAQNVR
jgi:hypothetical protein